MKTLRNKKGIDLSINLLIVVAMAIFALFLVVGFVLGGFTYFKNIFKGATTSETQGVQLRCQTDLTTFQTTYPDQKAEKGTFYYKQLCEPRNDIDLNNDGEITPEDTYQCSDFVKVRGACPAPGP